MAEKKSDRPQSDMPTQYGTASALSSSSDNIRPGYTPVPSPASDSDMATLPGVSPTPSSGAKRRPFASGQSGVGSRASSSSWDAAHGDETALEPGTVLAGRYEILDVLGKGGMGSVYKAKDQELDRLVALKVIRPELARNAAIVDRFKQELRLSHLVTHKHVIRMYDLGEDAGMRFITMEFVAGRDLRSIIEEKGKLAPVDAVGILRQICLALEAAHAVGILHRDLKPQNIMQDAAGRVVVMDFGLARTIEGDGMTQSGALVGTMEYMSPEQALGKDLDQRSDIFALGLICYEMLTGNMPFRAESALASLIKRTQERAAPISDINPTVPGALSGIIGKCLERDLQLRYASTTEILQDLEAWDGKRAAASLHFTANVPSAGLSGRWLLFAGAVLLVIALAVSGIMFFRKPSNSATADKATVGPTISLAIMPFYNASEDQSLNWLGSSLADMLSSDIGQSPHVRMVSPDRLHQVLTDLHISGSSQVDVAVLRRLAEFTNAETIVYGQYVRAGGQIRIDTTILDLTHDTRFTLKTEVPSEKDLLTSVDALAGDVRQKLSANPDILKELQAHAARPSTNSVAALRAYGDGLQLARAGRSLDAEKQFEVATQADPNFALAFSKLGEAYSQNGHDDLAEQASRRAVELSDSLPTQEKYLIEANNARITKDTPKAIAAYEHLATENPANADVQFALAGLYEQNSDYDSARKRLALVLATDPKNVDVLLASGRVELKAGNAQPGLDFLNRALSLSIQLDNQEEKAAILQAIGIAYSMLNKPDDAVRNYNESLNIKRQIGDKRGEAASLEQIGTLEDSTGHADESLASYKQSLAIRREIDDKAGIGNTLIDLGAFYISHGKPADALSYYTQALEIERELGDESNQALCLNNIGTMHVDEGHYQDALTYLDQAYQLRLKLKVPDDIAETLHNLAETNIKLGQYDAALDLYLKAIEAERTSNNQAGVANESDGMAKIFAVEGRYGAALSSMKTALDIVQKNKQTDRTTVGIVGGWGNLLSQVGREDEAKPNLDNALNMAHQIKDDASAALATNWIGDDYFYKGDYSSARQQYDQALAIASKTSDKEQTLIAKVDKAKVELALGHGAAQIAALKKLGTDADALGLKSLSVECSVYLGQALIASKNYTGARQELDLALARAEKLGLRIVEAKAQYLLATLLVQSGKVSDATPHYREVVRILESISKEENAARVLERSDLQSIYRESMKGFQGGN
jgi:serine/threonine protein kinase/tetratricopeptide (TPR) repeat protein